MRGSGADEALAPRFRTAAQLEDTFGIVHADLLREVNRFVYERCPKRAAK